MKDDSTFHDGIRASLFALRRTLIVATQETRAACRHISRREQNMAIGAIVAVEDLLEQATILYKGIISMHRCKL